MDRHNFLRFIWPLYSVQSIRIGEVFKEYTENNQVEHDNARWIKDYDHSYSTTNDKFVM